MKRFALYSLCIGFLTLAMSGCGNDSENSPKEKACTYTGNQCSADGQSLLKCENGMESTVMACPNGCADGACVQTAGCNYTQPKCSDDAKAVLTCNGGKESSLPCEHGCLNGACKTNPDTPACDYEGMRCSGDAAKVVKCEGGTEVVVSTCDNGCANDKCNEEVPECDYSGEK